MNGFFSLPWEQNKCGFMRQFQAELYRFNQPVCFCLETPVIPGPVSTHRSSLGDSRLRGNDGGYKLDRLCGTDKAHENENKKFTLKKPEFSDQIGIKFFSFDEIRQ